MIMRARRPSALLLVTLLAAGLGVAATPAAGAGARTPTVIGRQVIGYSVKHRPIVAYHLGNPRSSRTAVVLGQIHGDERAGVRVAKALLTGRPVAGLNLWVIPTVNPDGYARNTRQNARGVDLNRNFGYRWARLKGVHYSGKRALDQPESRAMMRFLTKVKPRYMASLHQPLSGVDSTDGGRIDRGFRNRLARNLALPVKAFRCWSECHGSMTRWYTHKRYGAAVTVEFGARPSAARLTKAPAAIIRAMGGRIGG